MGFSPVTVSEKPIYVSMNVSESGDPLVTNSYIIYSDLSQKNPGLYPLVYNMDSVMQAMDNLFNTQLGERLFRPTYGADLRKILFRPIIQATTVLLQQILIVAVEQWDVRIKVDRNNSRITPYPDDNLYDIYMVYTISGITDQTYAYQSVLVI